MVAISKRSSTNAKLMAIRKGVSKSGSHAECWEESNIVVMEPHSRRRRSSYIKTADLPTCGNQAPMLKHYLKRRTTKILVNDLELSATIRSHPLILNTRR